VNEKKRSKSENLKPNSHSSNLILNSIIVLLGVLIIFLTYSFITQISHFSRVESDKNNNKSASSIIQVEVLNGCGASGVAEQFTDLLRKEKFDVVQVGNYISFDIDNSLVIDRTGNRLNAEKVARALGIDSKNVIMQKNDDSFLDVSVVIGKDYKKLIQ